MSNFIYKYGFWILIIVTFTFFNLWRITKLGYNKDIALCENINNKRINSLFSANIIDIERNEPISGNDLIKPESTQNILKGKTLAILLAEFKCNKCQENELERLKQLQNKVKQYGIHIIGITTQKRKTATLLQKESLELTYPIYWIEEKFFKKISFAQEYPQIIYSIDNVIKGGFLPIAGDDEFSKNFYKTFLTHLSRKQ